MKCFVSILRFIFWAAFVPLWASGDGIKEINALDIPYQIANSGSYVLTGPVTGISGEHGIEISASQVTLDLNGFSLNGVSGSMDGISVTDEVTDLEIRNGMVQGWGSNGVNALSASNSIFSNLILHTNGAAGLVAGFNCLVDGLICFENGGEPGPSPSVTNAVGNGFRVENGSVIRHCISRKNNHHGLVTHSATRVETTVLWRNGHDGLHASHATSIRALNCGLNSEGVEVDTGSSIVNSSSSRNTEDGFRFKGGGGVIHGSIAMNNLDNGFDFRVPGVRVFGSVAYSNASHGFRLVDNSVAVLNLAALSGGAADKEGFKISGSNARIEGNHAVKNRTGFLVEAPAANSILLKNSASGNGSSAFSISASNHLSEADFPGTTIPNEPWTNFEF